jgi:hypothetical protein
MKFLPGMASNWDSSDLCLPSSWDYRREPLVPSSLCASDCLLAHLAWEQGSWGQINWADATHSVLLMESHRAAH